MALAGLTSVVTGGALGIGRATCLRLAREGARVTVADINSKAGEETAALIRDAGGKAHFVHTDCSKEESIQALVAASRELHSAPLDIVVNNAAQFYFGPLETTTRKDWMRLFECNVLGYATLIREALPDFRQRGKGAVVNVASVSSFIAQPDMFVYNATKGAVLQMTRCLALDLAKDNVRVNAVCPGPIFTPAQENHIKFLGMSLEDGQKMMGDETMLKRVGKPEEIASTVSFLASDDASFITGTYITVDGGLTA